MRAHVLIVAVAASAVGCAMYPLAQELAPCDSTADCPEGFACFAEGCAVPHSNLAVVVRPQASSALLPQDVALGLVDGSPLAIQLQPNAVAAVSVYEGPATAGATPYRGPYHIGASGALRHVPSAAVRYEARVADPQGGVLRMAASPGTYQVELLTDEPKIPPSFASAAFPAGKETAVPFNVSPKCTPPSFEYRVLVQRDSTNALPVRVIVQALESPSGRIPISQPLAVEPAAGMLGSTALCVAHQPPFQIQVRPDPSVAYSMPAKTFEVTLANLGDPLVFGAYGDLVHFSGRVVRSAKTRLSTPGAPVANARVRIEGKVTGGGFYTSRDATTDPSGFFRVSCLPGALSADRQRMSHSLYVWPPSGENETAAATVLAVTVDSATQAERSYEIPDKLEVRGLVTGPGGLPLAGVAVTAEPAVDPVLDPALMPQVATASAKTDFTGEYFLFVNPGRYRFHFDPSGALPRGYLPERTLGGDLSAGLVRMPQVAISSPVTVSGKLVSPGDIDPVTGGTLGVERSFIDLYRLVPGGLPVLVQRTQASDLGEFRLVLPAVEPAYLASSNK